MERQPQNPEFRNNPKKNVRPCYIQFFCSPVISDLFMLKSFRSLMK